MQTTPRPIEHINSSVSVDAICVDPAQVETFWPFVESFLQRAVDRTDLCHFEAVKQATLQGIGLLWIAWGQKLYGAATTELMVTQRSKACIITAAGGEDMKVCLPLLAKIETYAKNEGCDVVRIFGREGWQRMLPEYKRQAIVLERHL